NSVFALLGSSIKHLYNSTTKKPHKNGAYYNHYAKYILVDD
ncbi:MAG: hypothetical protein ACI9DO_000747, partial [Reinekea sp.]